MNKGKIRRRAQQGWRPASDYSSPWTETSLLNCHVTSPSPLVSEPYGSNTFPIHQNYSIERPLVTGPVYSLSAESQGVGDSGLSLPPQPERRQCLQDWGFSMPGQYIGTIPRHGSSSSTAENIPPHPYQSESDAYVEDEDDHVEWSLSREATHDIQSSVEQNKTETRYLACPFYKHDPTTFSKPKWKSCAHPGYENMHRLKDHLKRRHKATARLSIPEETIREIQFEQMKSWGRTSGRGRPAIEQWQHTYRILFPFDAMIPSPYQDEIPELVPGPARQSLRMNDDKILELLPSQLQSVIEEDEDLRYLPASSQQRIALKVKRSVEQLLNNDTEGSRKLDKTTVLPYSIEEARTLEVDHSLQLVGGNDDLERQTWNCLNPWIDDNQQSVPEEPISIFAYGLSELPHIPQHQLGWYGTAVDITDTPEIDAYMYEPRRPHRLKMHQSR